MPQTIMISRAVGRMWKTIEVSTKLMPFVPRSIALVKPPVCFERWKFRSSRRRCSNTLQATLRMAFWATFAKTAFRNSWKIAAAILVVPSSSIVSYCRHKVGMLHTCHYHSTSYCPCSPSNGTEIHIHRVHNAFEVEGYLYVQNL